MSLHRARLAAYAPSPADEARADSRLEESSYLRRYDCHVCAGSRWRYTADGLEPCGCDLSARAIVDEDEALDRLEAM